MIDNWNFQIAQHVSLVPNKPYYLISTWFSLRFQKAILPILIGLRNFPERVGIQYMVYLSIPCSVLLDGILTVYYNDRPITLKEYSLCKR